MTYAVLILGGFDNLFNVLFFLVGILFTLSVTSHHQISLTVCLPSPPVLTHTRPSSTILSRYSSFPAVPCSPPHFFDI